MSRKTLIVLEIIFAALTIAGAVYVMTSDGKASPGYAVIPMLFTLAIGGINKNNSRNKD